MERFDIRCSRCGRFCSPKDSDCGVPFGGPLDSEPPDEKYICPRCLTELMERVENDPNSIPTGGWYIKPKYVVKAELKQYNIL